MDTEENLIGLYLKIVETKKDLPVYNDFLALDVSRGTIRHHFGGIENLHAHMRETHVDELMVHFSTVESIFDPNRSIDVSTSKFVITTAVADSPADKNFLAALKLYCDTNDAQLVIMPCESVTNSFEKKTATFDPIFNEAHFRVVNSDVELNSNFSLCSIQVSAKQIKSITGLSRLGNREGSYVFASPKQFLEYIPSGNNRGKNYAIMTPGACTKPSYYTDTFVSKRLSYIAESDHTIGAIIVEIKDDTKFDFRQIQAASDGSFIDVGTQYNSDGTTSMVPANIILGDLHSTFIDRQALDYFIDKFIHLKVDHIFLHDIFDAYSISHHVKDIAEKAARSNQGADSLEEEVLLTFDTVKYVADKLNPTTVNIVKSNHDEFLDRYLAAGTYVEDPKNHLFSLRIAPTLFDEGEDVLKAAMNLVEVVPDNWRFLSREDSLRIGGVECAAHGDLGMNGAKCSLNSLEKIYGDSVTGHTHSAAIQRSIFRVGTLSDLNMRYNRGPSSWTQTCCLLYNNGQKQLINFIR